MKRLFSGVKPTADIPHLGNYIGAFRHWVQMQDEHESFICVVDLHTMTLPWDPSVLPSRTIQLAASLIACGIDPEKTILFVQSDVPEHAELQWVLTCIARMGELGRMTQFKDKSKGKDSASVGAGLFAYPVLMAADVLAYRAHLVPIGDDQKQHLELMRDIAERFNKVFGETFPIPEPIISENASRIMALDDPTKKMDKSDDHPNNLIWMSDGPDVVRKKIARAVTDSGSDVRYGKDKPAISNLLDIFSAVTTRSVGDLEKEFGESGYAVFKSAITEALIAFLEPFQKRYSEVMADKAQLGKMLVMGSEKAKEEAAKTLKIVRERIGVWRP